METFNLQDKSPWPEFNRAIRQAQSIKVTVAGKSSGSDCQFELDDEGTMHIDVKAPKTSRKSSQ
jgi:hypothetical protein